MPLSPRRFHARSLLRTAPFASSLCALAAACGSQADLLPGRGPGQGGGGAGAGDSAASTTASTASTSTTATTGVGGGSVTSCPYLGVTGQPISYTSAAALHGLRPELVRVSATETMALFAREDVNVPNPPATIGHLAFEPWGAWPQTLGSVLNAFSMGGEGFAVAPGAEEPSAALLFFLPTDAFPSDMYLAPVVRANEHYEYYPEGVAWDAWEPAFPTSLARGPGGHLAAYQLGIGSSFFLRLAEVRDDLTVTPTFDVACASARFPADLAPVAGGYLLASANGRDFGSCDDDDGIPGPATRLDVMLVAPMASSIPLATSFQGVDPLAHVILAPRAGGAWLAWQENGASSLVPPRVHAVALDDQGSPAGPPFDVTADGETTGPVAIADLGGTLAVAWVDNLDPSTPTIRFGVFDTSGGTVANAGYTFQESFLFRPSLSLVTSDDGEHLLASWAATGGAGPARVEVMRLSCLDGPPPP